MGYRGKVAEQEQARGLRAEGYMMLEIATGARRVRELRVPVDARRVLDEHAFLAAGTALYAGEGSKGDGEVRFANIDRRMIGFFCEWLRHFFEIDEDRLRVRLYLHQGLELEAAVRFWQQVTGIPAEHFRTPYRAVADPSIRKPKHVYGCAAVSYTCTPTHRAIMGLVRALLSSSRLPGW